MVKCGDCILCQTERRLYGAFMSLLSHAAKLCVCSDQGALKKIHGLEASQHHLSSTAETAKQQVAWTVHISLTALVSFPNPCADVYLQPKRSHTVVLAKHREAHHLFLQSLVLQNDSSDSNCRVV